MSDTTSDRRGQGIGPHQRPGIVVRRGKPARLDESDVLFDPQLLGGCFVFVVGVERPDESFAAEAKNQDVTTFADV